MGLIGNIIIGGVIGGIVWGIRLIIWKDEVPELISKWRWAIALLIGFIIIALEVNAGFELKNQAINGFIIYVIAEALKSERNKTYKKGDLYEE